MINASYFSEIHLFVMTPITQLAGVVATLLEAGTSSAKNYQTAPLAWSSTQRMDKLRELFIHDKSGLGGGST